MPICLCCFPLEFRVENLRKFKSDGDDCPTLVCSDLAARGLDLDVDHVVMFDFPLNSVSIISINLFSGLLGQSIFFLPSPFDILFPFYFRLTTFIAQVELLVWVQKVTNSYII